ncbi:ribosomal L1 domain-containing protein 1 [Tiliqua scincoides]|uniref:ribosomal L1 domain-containing protein 1 n=1 Tax=Tiliqua scincoides TaxID=71010 RepID=UPI0034636EA7
MAASQVEVPLDRAQVKKAAQALLAHNQAKQKTDEKLLLNVDQNVFLMVTVWKIPSQEQVIKIGLPHGIMPPTSDVCLFTKDEPGLTGEQTENLYKKLLSQHGITGVTEVISYKTLKAEYKPFEAKRRLLNRFSLFLSDDRIRRLLPSHIGKHFYRSKKAPLSVNLKAKNLAKEINRRIQGTTLPITNRGCCYTARVGHTGLQAEEISDNVVEAARIMALKAPKIWKSVKLLHLKTDRSVALPIFARSDPSSETLQHNSSGGVRQKKAKKKKPKKPIKKEASDELGETIEGNNVPAAGKEENGTVETSDVIEAKEEEEEIPQLVPIGTGTSVQRKKQVQPSPSTREGVKTSPASPLGKRKTSPEIPAIKPETLDDQSGPRSPKLLRRGRNAGTPKARALEKKLTKTPPTPEAVSSAVTRRMKKAIKSAKKSPEMPKRQLRKRNVSQST